MARFTLLLALVAAASALQGLAVTRPSPSTKIAVSRVAVSPIAMADEPSDKAVVIGAACVGGFIGVYFFHELSVAVILSGLLAYGATLSNPFGEVAKSTGKTATKVFDKTLELNEQYDLLPKAKGALDTVSVAAGNLNENYGITSKIDSQLKLSEKISQATSKVEEVRSSVDDKLTDLKTKAATKE